MAEEQQQQPALTPVNQPLSLIPVGLKEAALDSPTFRATAVHFGEQIDLIETWLQGYVKSASRLASEASTIESLVNSYLTCASPPQAVSEAVLDHDYTLLAINRHIQGAREFWNLTLRGLKRVEQQIVDPIKGFLQNDLRNLKEARRTLDNAQKYFDGTMARFAAQSKTKEASSLREDAFQLHEARRAYLKASMDFCVMAPQVRATLDKLLVKCFAEQWREMKSARESNANTFAKWMTEMDRVRGWSREMENGERAFRKELQTARRQIEDSAEFAIRPSRELDDYNTSTVPYIGTSAASGIKSPAKPDMPEKMEKQGWLFQRTITGKPQRTVWVRRWFFVKNGIFGWLVQGARSGAVEESEKIGVLLCGVRPAFQEERRFCFEIKTKDTTILLQAETQQELMEWIAVFEVAKRKALEDSGSLDSPLFSGSGHTDAAFAINPPIAPEFAAKTGEGHASIGGDELSIDRAGTLGIDRAATMSTDTLVPRGSFDVSRRLTNASEGEVSRSRETAARIIEKLDLHRKSNASPSLGPMPSPTVAGGIASLISASHNVLPAVAAGGASSTLQVDPTKQPAIPTSTLAPSTLANPPSMTNLSRTAVVVSGERGIGLGQTGGMPGGLLANLWGSTNWGYVNRLEKGDNKPPSHARSVSQPPTPVERPEGMQFELTAPAEGDEKSPSPGTKSPPLAAVHKKSMSVATDVPKSPRLVPDDYPSFYPLPLKAQDAQFRMLFPNVARNEHLVLVFRATWNPNEQQEFPGRVYVTPKEIYFYSHHIGLVLITGIHLATVAEVTAAPGRDCDFIFIHFKENARADGATRVTIKTFLEPLKLLQRRLNYLVRNANSRTPDDLEAVIKRLISYEGNTETQSPSVDSWEDVDVNTPMDGQYDQSGTDVRARLRIDGALYRDGVQRPGDKGMMNTRFKLPPHAVVYAPQDMPPVVVEKEYNVSAKALFHVMFGDKSALFQTLYGAGWADSLVQTPWTAAEQGQGYYRREFQYTVSGGTAVDDTQVIEVFNDHLCYVITDKKTPWYLPSSSSIVLTSKVVITHISKSRCKLAVFTKIDQLKTVPFSGLVRKQAENDLKLYAQDLADMVTDQVNRLGSNNNTRKALRIFGGIGQVTQSTQISAEQLPPPSISRRLHLVPRSTASLLSDAAKHHAGKILATGLGAMGSGVESLLKIFTAHTILIALLLLSAAWNGIYTSRDGWQWWQERTAAKFMSRVGVKPNMMMSRGVWLNDINNLTSISLVPTVRNASADAYGHDNQCLTTFHHLLHSTSPDADPSDPSLASSLGLAESSVSTAATARRLRRTRQNIAAQRHDLLVAMRVVNRVEEEVVKAEWENWVLDEVVRCRRVEEVLRSDKGHEEVKSVGQVKGWLEGYCGDCKRALEA